MTIKSLTSYVKKFLYFEQFAWIFISNIRYYSSETENYISRCDLLVENKLHKCEESDFKKWLVGFTDGVGSFNIFINKYNNIIFTFKLSQKKTNMRILYFIKKELGVGSVKESKDGMVHYIIKDNNILLNKIIPIYDQIQLKTTKIYNYKIFKESLDILNNNNISKTDKLIIIKSFKHNFKANITQDNFITKEWIIGYTEAVGRFYITKLNHGFSITQKNNKHLLEEIKKYINLTCDIKIKRSELTPYSVEIEANTKRQIYILDVIDKKSIKKIKDYYKDQFKGIKSLEYKLWAKTLKYKGNLKKLKEIKPIKNLIKV